MIPILTDKQHYEEYPYCGIVENGGGVKDAIGARIVNAKAPTVDYRWAVPLRRHETTGWNLADKKITFCTGCCISHR